MKNIRKMYKSRITVFLVLLVVLSVVSFGLIGKGIFEIVRGSVSPVTVSREIDLSKIANGNFLQDKYVSIESDSVYDILVDATDEGEITGKYLTVWLEDKFVFLEVSIDSYRDYLRGNTDSYSISGKAELMDFTYYNEMLNILEGDANAQTPIPEELLENDSFTSYVSLLRQNMEGKSDISEVFSRYYIVEDSPFFTGLPSIITGVVIFIVSFLVFYVGNIRPKRRAFKAMGDYANGNMDSYLDKVDSELNSMSGKEIKPFTLTYNYIISTKGAFVFAFPIKDIVWVYKKVISHKLYGFIPSGKTVSVNFVFSNGFSGNIIMNDARVDELMEYISSTNSKAIIGFNDELNDHFKRDPKGFVDSWKNK